LDVVLGIGLAVALELGFWSPGKELVTEFGQMLTVAFAYVSKMPSPEKHKMRPDSTGGQANLE
jgi:hypothetical protein